MIYRNKKLQRNRDDPETGSPTHASRGITHRLLQLLDRYRLVLGCLVVLFAGGGCMLAFTPIQPENLAKVGLTDHTRARLAGQADPNPSDPKPYCRLNGVMMIVGISRHPYNYNGYAYISSLSIDDGPAPATTFFIHPSRTSPRAMTAMQQLPGITGVITFEPPSDQAPGDARLTRTALLQAARAEGAGGAGGADLLLVYTAGADADATDLTLGIGSLLTLGFAPTVIVSGEAALEAALLDVHTGYVYASSESAGDSLSMTSHWGREGTRAGQAGEAIEEAFGRLARQLQAAWPDLRAAYP